MKGGTAACVPETNAVIAPPICFPLDVCVGVRHASGSPLIRRCAVSSISLHGVGCVNCSKL